MVVTLRYGHRSPVRKEEEEPMAKKKRMRYKLKTKQVKVNRVRANRKYKDTVFRIRNICCHCTMQFPVRHTQIQNSYRL